MEYPQRKERRKRNLEQSKARTVRNRKIVSLALILLGVLIIYHPVKNLAISKMIRYETAQWKVLEENIPIDAVCIREEIEITASEDGVFEPVILEGEKVAAGKTIGYIKTQAATANADSIKVAIKAPRAGLVSYKPDGLEEVLKPNLLDELDIDKVSALLTEQKDEASAFPKVERGKPICKIVDNLINPFLYIQCDDSFVKEIKSGQAMSVRFPNGITSRIIVREIKKSDTQSVVLAEVFDAPDLKLEKRHVDLELIIKSYEGVAVLKDALVTNIGEKGVFIPRKGVCQWIKVELKGDVGGEAVVTGLDAGSQYIVNPSLVHQGQRIK